mgnify:CR=1 FL=1
MKTGHRVGKCRIDPIEGIYSFRGYEDPVSMVDSLSSISDKYRVSGTIIVAGKTAVITATSGDLTDMLSELRKELKILGVEIVVWERHGDFGVREVEFKI